MDRWLDNPNARYPRHFRLGKNKMCLLNTDAPGSNNVQNGYFQRSCGPWCHLKVSCMPSMKSLLLVVQKLCPRLIIFYTERGTDSQMGQGTKTRCLDSIPGA